MKVDSFKCDGPNCKNVKGPNNHWFRAKWAGGEFHITLWDQPFPELLIGLAEAHVCSESCAAKLMSKVIGAGVTGSGE